MLQLRGNFFGGHTTKFMPLTPRQHRRGDFVYFRRREDEDGMRGRFFERFEKCIERRHRKHVNFVNDVDFIFPLRRGEVDFIAQVADIIHAIIRGGVYFDEIHETVFVDREAMFTLIARTRGRIFRKAVDGFREEPRNGGFSGAARPGKEVRVAHAVVCEGVSQCTNDMLLTYDLVPGLGAPFSIQGL
jgi:hypothetical protein